MKDKLLITCFCGSQSWRDRKTFRQFHVVPSLMSHQFIIILLLIELFINSVFPWSNLKIKKISIIFLDNNLVILFLTAWKKFLFKVIVASVLGLKKLQLKHQMQAVISSHQQCGKSTRVKWRVITTLLASSLASCADRSFWSWPWLCLVPGSRDVSVPL